MRSVRDIPTLRMNTSIGPEKDLFAYLRRCKAAATTRCRILRQCGPMLVMEPNVV